VLTNAHKQCVKSCRVSEHVAAGLHHSSSSSQLLADTAAKPAVNLATLLLCPDVRALDMSGAFPLWDIILSVPAAQGE
jgi:hypothetical protein